MAHTCPIEEASRFGVISVDDNQLITGFSEKPKKPAALPWSPGLSLISMGVYMFETAVLVKALINDAKNPRSTHDFGHDVIPELIKRHKTYAYTYEDYWQDIGTIDAYWQANMDFLTTAAPFQLNDPDWPIRTYRPQYPSSFITNGNINNSILGSGCLIMGGRIENSILSSGVIVEDEAEIEDSIIFEGTVIKKGAKLQRTILDKQIVIPPKFSVGFDLEKDKSYFKISGGGIRVIPKAWRLE
jgi:glucose-1-phosphate adenylyltransferase